MYHPLALDQIRVQQEDLRRRNEARRRNVDVPAQRRAARRGVRPLLMRLAFTDTVMRPVGPACADC